MPASNIAAIQWETKDNFIQKDNSTNIFIAAFTTCYALLKLYNEIDRLGESVLYFDADNIIYESYISNDPPVENFLGQFTDELNGGIITSFVPGMISFLLI